MTNLEMLLWGVRHIAENHGFEACTNNYEEDGEVCIWGGINVPTISDVRFLCEDLGIDYDKFVYAGECGIDIELPYRWMRDKAEKAFKGNMFWKRKG